MKMIKSSLKPAIKAQNYTWDTFWCSELSLSHIPPFLASLTGEWTRTKVLEIISALSPSLEGLGFSICTSLQAGA